jgi:hypothetical protein
LDILSYCTEQYRRYFSKTTAHRAKKDIKKPSENPYQRRSVLVIDVGTMFEESTPHSKILTSAIGMF